MATSASSSSSSSPSPDLSFPPELLTQIPKATTAEQYVDLEIGQTLIDQWIKEGYSHLHIGAVQIILTLHDRKELPVTARIALLNTVYKDYKQANIGTCLSTLHAGSISLTYYPNFNIPLRIAICTTASKSSSRLWKIFPFKALKLMDQRFTLTRSMVTSFGMLISLCVIMTALANALPKSTTSLANLIVDTIPQTTQTVHGSVCYLPRSHLFLFMTELYKSSELKDFCPSSLLNPFLVSWPLAMIRIFHL
ncbi:hypothetical protein Dsin_002193 [Dipteronia sinensis]|uniref:Uncharacterized protein n=1 Tax=Dipteronia sinensis TaxID=43782 RepID=A0AAE0B5N5_9ROSI|nr:hypothetical protein Dsin_002193 [Dipteronia sinensis]